MSGKSNFGNEGVSTEVRHGEGSTTPSMQANIGAVNCEAALPTTSNVIDTEERQEKAEPKEAVSVPEVIKHLRDNFGAIAKSLEPQVYRYGLVHMSVEEMYSFFFSRNLQFVHIVLQQVEYEVFRAQIQSMLLAILSEEFGDNTEPLVDCMMAYTDDTTLFSCLLSAETLENMVTFAQQMMTGTSTFPSGFGGPPQSRGMQSAFPPRMPPSNFREFRNQTEPMEQRPYQGMGMFADTAPARPGPPGARSFGRGMGASADHRDMRDTNQQHHLLNGDQASAHAGGRLPTNQQTTSSGGAMNSGTGLPGEPRVSPPTMSHADSFNVPHGTPSRGDWPHVLPSPSPQGAGVMPPASFPDGNQHGQQQRERAPASPHFHHHHHQMVPFRSPVSSQNTSPQTVTPSIASASSPSSMPPPGQWQMKAAGMPQHRHNFLMPHHHHAGNASPVKSTSPPSNWSNKQSPAPPTMTQMVRRTPPRPSHIQPQQGAPQPRSLGIPAPHSAQQQQQQQHLRMQVGSQSPIPPPTQSTQATPSASPRTVPPVSHHHHMHMVHHQHRGGGVMPPATAAVQPSSPTPVENASAENKTPSQVSQYSSPTSGPHIHHTMRPSGPATGSGASAGGNGQTSSPVGSSVPSQTPNKTLAKVPVPHHHHHFAHPHMGGSVPPSQHPPSSIDAMGGEDSQPPAGWSSQGAAWSSDQEELRAFLVKGGVAENVVSVVLSLGKTLQDYREMNYTQFDKFSRQYITPLVTRQRVWDIVRVGGSIISPQEKTQNASDTLKNFLLANSISNGSAQDGEDGDQMNSSTRRSQQESQSTGGKNSLTLPQPRTKFQQMHQLSGADNGGQLPPPMDGSALDTDGVKRGVRPSPRTTPFSGKYRGSFEDAEDVGEDDRSRRGGRRFTGGRGLGMGGSGYGRGGSHRGGRQFREGDENTPCRFHTQPEGCRYGDKCRFRHPA